MEQLTKEELDGFEKGENWIRVNGYEFHLDDYLTALKELRDRFAAIVIVKAFSRGVGLAVNSCGGAFEQRITWDYCGEEIKRAVNEALRDVSNDLQDLQSAPLVLAESRAVAPLSETWAQYQDRLKDQRIEREIVAVQRENEDLRVQIEKLQDALAAANEAAAAAQDAAAKKRSKAGALAAIGSIFRF